ncbi:hypothetical protein GCM10010195_55860 [Kitasatospora griseola]|nr:hypothetical protein GCM10010195_55860 [Kitasatospora griseola]
MQQFGGGSEDAGPAEQGGAAVLAAQGEGEGVVPGGERGAFLLGPRERLAGGAGGPFGVGEGGAGQVVAAFNLLVAGFGPFAAFEEFPVFGLGGLGAQQGFVAGGGEPFDLGFGGGGAGAGGGGLALQPGQALAPVGDRPGGRSESQLLGGEGAFEFGAFLDGFGERVLGLLQGGFEGGFLLADPGGLAFQVLGVAAAPFLQLPGGGGGPDPGFGESDGAAGAFGERGQPVPGLPGGFQGRPELFDLGFQDGFALDGGGELLFDGGAAQFQRQLVGDFRFDGLAQGEQVVGEQPQPGVAQLGLDAGGPPGDLRLPPQRAELAAQFGDQVLDPVQVGLHRVDLPQRLLLALAVLEDAGRLLDEGAPAHRVGVQHGVELSLADDHVHLAADAGVGEQFLDVQEPADGAVERVLAAAVAEHRPGDGDFGVVDGQRAVGVVDGEADFGAAERGASAGPREDHVLHLAAAQRLGALFAHHPGQCVDHVGLAGAVGADHAGDAGFEAQRGRRGEGLEPAQGQALQVHPPVLLALP